ncbi:MAG: hypothetical protein ACRENP_23005 [Longimicrobiales bacterium]
MQLLDWAKTRAAWIIEDDYDSEFRYRADGNREKQFAPLGV